MVQWEDVVIRELGFEPLKLHKNSLRAAETQIGSHEDAKKQNRAGGSSRTARNIG